MFSLFQLKKIFQLNDNFFYWLKITFLSLIIFGLILSLIVSPKDYLQGDTVRIMYVHVPASWLALMIFAAMGISSIITLVFKIRVFTIYAKSLAPIGFTFSLISIFTGSLWGIKTPRFQIYKDLDIGPSPIIASGKAAILQYAKFLAEREATFGITVNSLLPGWFPRKGKIERKDYIKRIKDNIPLNRIGNLKDLVSAIEFLISNQSSYVTLHELIFYGGYSLS